MSCRSSWWLGLAGVVALLPAASLADSGSSDNGSDRRSQSHVPIPLHGMDLQQALAERVQVLKESSEAREYFQKFLENYREFAKDQQKLDRLLELLNKGPLPFDPNDPRFQVQGLRKKYESQKQLLTPERQEKIKQIFDRVDRELKQGNISGGKPSTGLDGNGGAPTAGENTPPHNEQPRPDLRGHPPTQSPPPADSEEEQNLIQKFARSVAEHIEMQEGPWTDSSAVREFIREFKRPHLEMGDWSGLDENSWTGKFAGLSRSLVQSDFWPEVDWSRLGKINVPSNIDLPKVKMPWKPPSSAGIPRIPLPSASSLNRGLGLLWVAITIVLAVVVWKYLRARSAEQASRQNRAWKLGPWPVSPAAVASREELILAFEYLSLLKVGPAARSRNHLALADALGNQESGVRGQESGDRRRAAQHLASLYEFARYAPDRNPLSDDALTAARRELCFLAETASA